MSQMSQRLASKEDVLAQLARGHVSPTVLDALVHILAGNSLCCFRACAHHKYKQRPQAVP
jgi:hypothetical protein